MRTVKITVLTLALLVGLSRAAPAAILSGLTNWGGAYVLSLIQGSVNGKVTAQKISGNPVTGVTFQDFAITDPQGRIFLTAQELQIRLSLASLPTFHLDLGNITLVKPQIFLQRQAAGPWNFSRLIKETPQSPQPPGLGERVTKVFLREIQLGNLAIVSGELIVNDAGVTRRYPHLDLKSSLSLKNLGTPKLDVAFKVAELGLSTPQGRAVLQAGLRYRADRVQLKAFNLKLAGRTVLALQGQICRPLTKLTCTLTGKLGPLPGAVLHGFYAKWPAPWDLSGDFNLSTTPEGGRVKLQGKIGQADLGLTGHLNAALETPVFNLDLDLKGLTTAQIREIKDLNVKSLQGLSPVNAKLNLSGTGLPWKPQSLKGRLELSPFRYNRLQVEKARVELSGNADGQDLQIAVAGNFGSLDLSAQGRLLPLGQAGKELSGQLTLQTVDLQPAMVGLKQLPQTTLSTCFVGKFRLPANFDTARLHLAGDLQARGRLKNQPLQDLEAAFVLEGKKLAISQSQVRMAGLDASLEGTLSPAGLDVNFSASVAGSRSLPLPAGTSFAALRVEGAARGTWKAPQVNLSAQLRQLSLQGVTLKSAALNGSLTGLPPSSGSLEILGQGLKTPAGTFTRLSFTARGNDYHWQFKVAATSPKQPQFHLAGTGDFATRPLALNVTLASWSSRALKVKNQGPFQVHFLPGWEISPATFRVDGGTVTIAALARGPQLSGHLDVKNLSAGLLAPLGLPASGKLNGRLTLAGTPGTPVIQAKAALTHGKIKGIAIRDLSTTLAYQAQQAQVAGHLEMGPQPSRLLWKGTVPLKLSLQPFAFSLGQEGLDFRLSSEQLNLSMLTAFSKEVEIAQGPIHLLVEARGNPSHPRVSGQVRWSAGSVQLRPAGATYRLAPGEIRLEGDKIVIPGLVIQSDGTIRLTGTVLLTGTPQVRVRLTAANFQLLDRGGNEAWANGYIDLQGPLTALVARGRLVVPKAQFHPNFFRSTQDPDIILVPRKPKAKAAKGSPPGIYQNLRIDLRVESPGNVRVIDPMGKVKLTVNIKVTKKPRRKLALGGQIRSLKGSLDIEGKTFKVERAILTLPGVPGKPIQVDAKATHEMDDITLVLAVNGTVTNPQIHLESQPPLPPADVLSYLVFGAPAATLTKDQYLAMGVQQLGVLGGISAGKVSDILGSTIPFLSGIKVKTGMVGGRPSVGVEKEVVKNVSVFVGRHLDEERGTYERQVGVEYKINKHWSVESQFGTRNSGADVLFNYDF